jgi:AmiR/NasT family two-component response regulator
MMSYLFLIFSYQIQQLTRNHVSDSLVMGVGISMANNVNSFGDGRVHGYCINPLFIIQLCAVLQMEIQNYHKQVNYFDMST